MTKNALFMIIATICMLSLASCSEENSESSKASSAGTEQIPNIDIKSVYNEALELLEKGEEMVAIDESGDRSRCLNLFKLSNPRVRELRKIVDTHHAKNYPTLGAAFGDLVNCTSCLNSRASCDMAKEHLKSTKELYKF